MPRRLLRALLVAGVVLGYGSAFVEFRWFHRMHSGAFQRQMGHSCQDGAAPPDARPGLQ